jgi:thiamine pyrophosphokinase
VRAIVVAGSGLTGLPPTGREPMGTSSLGPGPVPMLDPVLLDGGDLLIAVDAGADALLLAGLRPHVLIGDMDSVSGAAVAELEAAGTEIVRLAVAKDETDTEAALRLAVGRGAEQILVFGALGGPRLDHLVGNLLLLGAGWLQPVDVRLRDELHEVFLVKGGADIAGCEGDIVSLFPLTPEVADVSTEGLEYPLRGETLIQATTRGVSNTMTASTARVEHGDGVLLLVHYLGR